MKRKDLSNLAWLLGRIWQYAKKYRVSIVIMILSMALYAASSRTLIYFMQPFADKIIVSTHIKTPTDDRPKLSPEGGEEPGFMERWGLSVFRKYVHSEEGLSGEGGVNTLEDEKTGLKTADLKLGMLVVMCILVFVLSVVAGGTHYLATYLSKLNVTRVIVDLRSTLCRHLLSLSMKFYSKRKMGDLLSRLTNDLQYSQKALDLLFEDFVLQPFFILASLVLAFQAHWQIAFLLFIILPAGVLPMVKFGRRVLRSGRKSLEVLGDTTQAMTQMLTGIRTVKAFKMEEREIGEFDELQGKYVGRVMKMIGAKATSDGIITIIQGLGFSILLALAGYAIIFHPGYITMGQLALLVMAMSATYQPMKKLSKGYNSLNEALAGLQRIFEVLDLQPDIRDARGSRDLPAIEGSIRFENVSFSYEEENVLQDISFEVPAGKTVALVGPSGAGKSTLLDLIARFYDPTEGKITLDGVNLKEIRLESLIRHIAIVSQDPFLFNTTISDNIRYGNREASMEEIVEAARAANIHDFIEVLPEKYGTVVGERGVRLSGGQLQRITIARAILKKASILLLDEATSSLDSEAERAVQIALDNLMEGKTSFVIAHRLSTIRNADLILVLDQGRLVESGSHGALMRKNGLYRRLHEMQFSLS